MKITLQQCMLMIAMAVSIIMTWIAAMDSHYMAAVFLAEAVIAVWILAGTIRHKEKLPYRTEEEY